MSALKNEIGTPTFFKALGFDLGTICNLMTQAISLYHSLVETSPFGFFYSVYCSKIDEKRDFVSNFVKEKKSKNISSLKLITLGSNEP